MCQLDFSDGLSLLRANELRRGECLFSLRPGKVRARSKVMLGQRAHGAFEHGGTLLGRARGSHDLGTSECAQERIRDVEGDLEADNIAARMGELAVSKRSVYRGHSGEQPKHVPGR